MCNDAFNKYSDITERKDLYSVKPDAKNKGKGVTPLVMDKNPALPHVSSSIHRHRHLLEKDESLKTVIPPGSVFLSCRKNKTIGGMLIHNRFRPSSSSTQLVWSVMDKMRSKPAFHSRGLKKNLGPLKGL